MAKGKERAVISSEELEAAIERLKARFPYQFAKKPNGGFFIDPGWLPIVERLCEDVDNVLRREAKDVFRWEQIKEKFGSLRAYWHGGPVSVDVSMPDGTRLRFKNRSRPPRAIDAETAERIEALVRQAEFDSSKTCSWCGAAGKPGAVGHWIVTACARCKAREARCFARDEGESRTSNNRLGN